MRETNPLLKTLIKRQKRRIALLGVVLILFSVASCMRLPSKPEDEPLSATSFSTTAKTTAPPTTRKAATRPAARWCGVTTPSARRLCVGLAKQPPFANSGAGRWIG